MLLTLSRVTSLSAGQWSITDLPFMAMTGEVSGFSGRLTCILNRATSMLTRGTRYLSEPIVRARVMGQGNGGYVNEYACTRILTQCQDQGYVESLWANHVFVSNQNEWIESFAIQNGVFNIRMVSIWIAISHAWYEIELIMTLLEWRQF